MTIRINKKYDAICLSLYFLILVVQGCNQHNTGSKSYKLVWKDEFNYTGSPDSTKWSYDLGDGCPNVCGWGNNELQYYTKSKQNVRVKHGSLIIEARKEEKEGNNYTSTRLLSRDKAAWKYGRFEIRASLPSGTGTWPAIWMLPEEWEYGGWPASGEIDIMEHVGHEPSRVYATVHTKTFNHVKGTQDTDTLRMDDAEKTFHRYALEWTPEKITWFVDDRLYSTFKNRKKTYQEWPFDQPFHLILNIAVGGNWGGTQGVDDKIWPQQMVVDYIRVYQKNQSHIKVRKHYYFVTMTTRKIVFLIVFIILQLGLIWPIYPLFSSIEPIILGLPLSFAWIIGMLLGCFFLLLWYYLSDPELESEHSKS